MNAPGYKEAEQWSPNNHARGGTKPTLFLLHTQEGDGTAQSLAAYLCNPGSQVSYHYSIDDQGNVRDVVDTDLCSWSVLDANPYTINLCFAGSYAAWTRAQWLANMSHAIEIAAWLAVQDCRKYGIPTTVIAPPYKRGAGISDHRYVTKVLGIGTHTDVGDGFPWDVFAGHVARFANPTPASGGTAVTYPAQDQMIREIYDQLRGPGGKGWPQLGGLTPVDALAKALTMLTTIGGVLGKIATKLGA